MRTVGILHPGHMGTALAAAMLGRGTRVLWASEGRSKGTGDRANSVGLEDARSLTTLARQADVVLSICPPDAATSVAEAVAATGFEGFYVDANAVSPVHMAAVAAVASEGGAKVVDGSVIGPPPWEYGTTRLYLSGAGAQDVAGLFADSPCEVRVLGEGVGRASALKMSFAAWTKGSWALQAACLALADAHGLRAELETEWETWWPGRMESTDANLRMCAPKAWRFVGEMKLISQTFEAAGLPGDFHQGAEAIWKRWSHHRGEEGATPELPEMIAELHQKE